MALGASLWILMLCAMCEHTARNEARYYAITVAVSDVSTAALLAAVAAAFRVAIQYFTVQPYGVVFAVDTALPASASFNATRT